MTPPADRYSGPYEVHVEWADGRGTNQHATGSRSGSPRLVRGSEQAIALDPYNEAAHQVAMHAESVLGLRQAIVGRYERLCQELDTRFGLEPEHETRVLYRRLLSQDGREALRHLSPAPASPEGVRRY